MTTFGSTGALKPAINVGMIGPRGSGKTTLAVVITKVLAGRGRAYARTKEELEGAYRKGVYYSGPNYYVQYEGATRRYIHLDQPADRASFRRRHVGGLRQLDVAVVVVAAGRPITRESLARSVGALRAAGVSAWIGFVSMVDRCARVREVDETEAALRETLWELGVDGDALPVIRGSATLVMSGERGVWGAGAVHAYIEALERHVRLPARERGAALLLPIESVLDRGGSRCLVAGKIERGVTELHERVSLIGADGKAHAATIAGLDLLGRELRRASAGDTLCVVIRGPSEDHVRVGAVLMTANSLRPARFLRMTIDDVITPREELVAVAADEAGVVFRIPPGRLSLRVHTDEVVASLLSSPQGARLDGALVYDLQLARPVVAWEGLPAALQTPRGLALGRVTRVL